MLLPLAWLIRIEDKPEHRKWLKQIAEDLLALQDECGAIREEIGSGPQGMFGPPKSNDAYGTDEAPLIQENGDPACDLLYTCVPRLARGRCRYWRWILFAGGGTSGGIFVPHPGAFFRSSRTRWRLVPGFRL